MELVKATIADVNKYLEIEGYFANLKTYSVFTSPEEVKKEIENNCIYFIEDGGHTVGRLAYQRKDKDHIYFGDLVILPQFQNRGLGRRAMEKILEQIGSIKKIDLITHPDNIPSVKLYESLGFKFKERKENHFGDGEPRIVMEKIYGDQS